MSSELLDNKVASPEEVKARKAEIAKILSDILKPLNPKVRETFFAKESAAPVVDLEAGAAVTEEDTKPYSPNVDSSVMKSTVPMGERTQEMYQVLGSSSEVENIIGDLSAQIDMTEGTDKNKMAVKSLLSSVEFLLSRLLSSEFNDTEAYKMLFKIITKLQMILSDGVIEDREVDALIQPEPSPTPADLNRLVARLKEEDKPTAV